MGVVFRYLAKEILLASLLVMAGLLALFLVFDFIRELGDVGRPGFTLLRILILVTLSLPSNAYVVLPLALLIGTLLALSRLSLQSELAVMRASGLSLARLAALIAMLGSAMAVVLFAFGEFVVPYAEATSKKLRLQASSSVVAQEFRSGFWVKDERSFVNIQAVTPDTVLQGVRIYEFDDRSRLLRISHAKTAQFSSDGKWRLSEIQRTTFSTNGTRVDNHAELEWRSVLTPDLLSALRVKPAEMSLANLSAYIDHLRENKQKSTQYELALWFKVVRPFALVVLMLVAVPFAIQSARAGGVGTRILIGIVFGVGFHFLGQLSGHLALLNDWSPLMTTLLPPLVILGCILLALSWMDHPRSRMAA
ncbi:MAG: LPS export ABC transporter permease LptG [Burkholderiales bacterium]|nr:LPS export ABC transporter permease LptG [Burkholderiales bacterium]